MRIIVVGDGKVGHTIAAQLTKEDHAVVIIDTDDEVIRRLEDELDVMCIRGNGANAQTLIEAGADRFALWDTFGRVTPRAMWAVARKLGHTELVKEGIDPDYRIFRLQELAGNDISRYLPIWGG